MREFELIESSPSVLEISDEEAKKLSALGFELASKSTWWGAKSSDVDRSVIGLEMQNVGRYKVTFRDVIGVVQFGDLQLKIKPKIPALHFKYIVQQSSIAPRIKDSPISIHDGTDYLELLAQWFVTCSETLLRRGLRKGYTEFEETLPYVRGQLHTLETLINTQRGIPEAVCTFDEFTENTSLNRVIKAAALKVAATFSISNLSKNRAHKILLRLEEVGNLRSGDTQITLDRLASEYSEVLPLSLLILRSLGFDSKLNGKSGKSFLIRTPEIIEDGLRNILSEGIKGINIEKRKLVLGETGLSINPDLIFGNTLAVGDVKYRYFDKDWSKNAFYQIVSFATGFRTNKAAVFGFTQNRLATLPRPVSIGGINTRVFAWNAASDIDPMNSSTRLITEVKDWLLQTPSEI